MNYKETKEFIKTNEGLYTKLKAAVSTLINNKNLAIRSSRVEEMNLEESFSLLFEPYSDDSSFILKRKDRLVGFILLNLLEDSLGKEISKTLSTAFNEVDEYLLLIKQPEPNHIWYLHLDIELLEFILLKQYHDNIIDFIGMINVLDNSHDKAQYFLSRNHLFIYERCFFQILNEVDTTTETFYNLVSKLCLNPKYFDSVKASIEEHCSDPVKGIHLYQYGRQNNSHSIPLFNTICLVTISKSNLDFAYNEALSLKDINPYDCIVSLMFFDYDTNERLLKSYNLVAENEFNILEKLKFYCKVLNNHVISEIQINQSFNEITKMIDPLNLKLYSSILWWVTTIEGCDNKKEELLLKIINLNLPYDLNSFYSKYKDKRYLFNHLKERYTQYKGFITEFQTILHQVYGENKSLFESEVFNLLCSNKIEEALLAIEIIKSDNHGLFDLDYLILNEENQKTAFIRITNRLLFLNDIFPFLGKFENSKYQSVFDLFKMKCFEYIDAFGSKYLSYAEKYLDKDKNPQLLEELKEYNQKLEGISELKKTINEFDPYRNYYRSYSKYLELEHRKMSIQQEKIKFSNGSIFGLFKNISVIRGSCYKSEKSNKLTQLENLSFSNFVDKRIYEDPIKFTEKYNNVFKTN